ncbi:MULTISPECIES: hypothetical protein [unclassified Akkermansia]|jgi:hypothetical protein|uniref:hypothetical protein n=2 Tax=unclassified Akkermansia TaxID=2608915 RepID=UPI0007999FBD|nr:MULTISPECIES: hypothetical protein [unclassified Akkermansia]KXT54611.1 hypothetical protein HMPREF3038_00289 [Akkermansia sp. KLE1797]KXU54960.1 hypothetical protein HMPREF3039_00841 [Akkermansia sp. KLE1798]KZA04410.1 hypothetical protein HMPREF1326_01920 [Akkermansia sp. KLE1605]
MKRAISQMHQKCFSQKMKTIDYIVLEHGILWGVVIYREEYGKVQTCTLEYHVLVPEKTLSIFIKNPHSMYSKEKKRDFSLYASV